MTIDEGRWYAGSVVLLLALMAGTWGLRTWHVSQVEATAHEHQEQIVEDAFAYIERDVEQLQRRLRSWAERLADRPGLIRGLRAYNEEGATQHPDDLIQLFSTRTLSERWAAELYDPTPRLIAWHGFSMPLDAMPATDRFLETVQVTTVSDDEWRRALVLWVPVRDGARVLGTLRVMHLLEARMPVENQYLDSYFRADTWRRETGLPIRVQFGSSFPQDAPPQQRARLLNGLDGNVLARVLITPPSPERLVKTTRTRYDDVLALWTMLLLFWLIAGTWIWYQRPHRARLDREHDGGLVLRFLVLTGVWWAVRYGLLWMDVPARWQRGKAPLAPLFDPIHFASTVGGGLMRSTGDFLLTALFGLAFSFAFLDLTRRLYPEAFPLRLPHARLHPPGAHRSSPLRFLTVIAAGMLLLVGGTALLHTVAQHAVLDSTLDYFARTGLLPTSLVVLVFCTLLLVTIAVVVVAVGLMRIVSRLLLRSWPTGWSPWGLIPAILLAASLPLVTLYSLTDSQMPWLTCAGLLVIAPGIVIVGRQQTTRPLDLLTLRTILPSIFLFSLLLYPTFYSGMEAQRRIQMVDASTSFEERRDPRAVFAIEQVLHDAQARFPASGEEETPRQRTLDSLAATLLRGSLLTSLGPYDASLTVFDSTGTPVGRYDATNRGGSRSTLDEADTYEFQVLLQMYAESRSTGSMIEPMTGRREPDRIQYVGIIPILARDRPSGWVMVRAEPQPLPDENTPFPRVLLPASFYGNLYQNVSLAEFRDGVLVRSFGRDFGRYRLDEAVRRTLLTDAELWRSEQVKDRRYITYYQRQTTLPRPADVSPVMASVHTAVTAVRMPATNAFDHLYYLLRLTVAGLFIGVPFYLIGLVIRWRRGLLPAPRIRFRDKVLNAFLGVGIITVAAVGFVGRQVVIEETEGAIQSWLQQHLRRVEETLALDAQGNEMAYGVVDRTHIDSLAARVGLDLNLYKGNRLVASSQPRLVQEGLIDQRLPVRAYQALYHEGYHFTYEEAQLGSFTYTTGFHALLDEQGQPRYILSIPTLPEQERIEEERARTVAYLFGALLLLVLVVMLTAAVLSNALARPMARLRVGLQDVAEGHFERTLPVDTRDEIGELVQTFNAMQQQLAESRRKLAQQERQLAWREMARQVAHEIKNPLTPMKLSVQHLRRAYKRFAATQGSHDGPAEEDTRGFADLFDRITATLVEQIDALAHIANDFSSFARMPKRVTERLDLNAVIREAADLMQAESDADLDLDLHPEPLIVEADREEIRRVYINLIKNALQALPKDLPGHIEIKTHPLDENGQDPISAYSTVHDNGTGIPEELREKIFEPNFSTKTSGTGLGLPIAQKSIRDMDGEIGFETEEGNGTTFWVRLPLADA